MSSQQTQTSYNPFTAIGRYNIKDFFYQHKKGVIGVSVLVLFILFIMLYNVYYSKEGHDKQNLNIYRNPPPPMYGVGPYGYGLYAPPKEILDFQN